MKNRVILAAFAVGIALTPAAFAQRAPQAPPAATTPVPPTPNDLDQIVCKREAPTTGTRLGGHRVCQTQREWDDRMRQDQQQLEQDQRPIGSPPGG